MRAWRLAVMMMAAATVALAGCIEPQDNQGASGSTSFDDLPTGTTECPGHGLTPTGASQSGVSNSPGAFSYGGQSMAKTGTEVYIWENPSGGAWVQWGGQAATGSVKLRIQDKCGEELYAKEFTGMQQGGGQESTPRGMPGDWAITLEFTAYTGQMGLQVTSG